MNIYECMKADRRGQHELATRILETADGSCEMQSLFDELCDAVESSAAAEEQTFYADLLAFPDGRTLVQRSVVAHDETVMLLDALADREFCTASWLTDFARLASVLERRCSSEETETFALADSLIEPGRAARLGERYAEAKRQWLATYGRQMPTTIPSRQPASQSALVHAGSVGVTASRRQSARFCLRGRPSIWLNRIGRPLRAARRSRWPMATHVYEASSTIPDGASGWRPKRPRNG
ncbi:hemerythrin domain-containing protein [Pelagibius sp. 7325]|uniref:hemerythrin domain-containing protein n=1 Tax=Pelagibius sp. 7325 TaxID=3131994 RepID=UPI0030EF0802